MIVAKGLIDYYLLGGAVDYVNDLAVEKTSKVNCERSRKLLVHYTTPVKVALCWFEHSTVLTIATAGWLPSTAGITVGVLGSIPFIKPFLRDLSSHIIKCYHQFSGLEITACITIVALLSLAQYAVLYSVISMPQSKFIPLSFSLSDVTLDTCLVITTELLRHVAAANAKTSPTERSPLSTTRHGGRKDAAKIVSAQEVIASKLQEAQAEVAKYQMILDNIQAFITAHPELQTLCEVYMVKDQANIAFVKNEGSLDPNNEVDAMTQMRIKGNHLQHTFTEYMEFIRRNHEVQEAFEKYIKTDPQAFQAFQEMVQAPAAAETEAASRIEEIDD